MRAAADVVMLFNDPPKLDSHGVAEEEAEAITIELKGR